MRRRDVLVFAATTIVVGSGLCRTTFAAATPNLSDFLPDLVMERENAANTIAKLHDREKDSPEDLRAADGRYMDLVAGVNGFLKSVAFQIETNQMDEDRWKIQATALLAKAKDFDASAAEVVRKQARDDDSIGGSRGGPLPPGAPGVKPAIGFTFDPVSTGMNLFKGLQDLKHSGQTFDDSQRKELAENIRNDSLWYDLDTVLKRSAPVLTSSPEAPSPRHRR